MRRSLALVLCACLTWFVGAQGAAAQLQAQAQVPVELRLEGLFGPDVGVFDSYTPLVVRATNRTRAALQGEIVVTARSWDATRTVHRLRLDLPPGEQRQAVLSIPSFEGSNILRADYVSGQRLATVETTLQGNGSPSIVLLDDPPRLRGALSGLEAPNDRGSTQPIALGQVSTDARSGDPLLPRDPAGWAPVQLAVATIPALGHAGATELRALESWLHAGGNLLLIPTSDADLTHPFVQRNLGDLARGPTGQLACTGRAQTDPIGCRAALGFGAVWISSANFTEPTRLIDPTTREAIRLLWDQTSFAPQRQILEPFRRAPYSVPGLDPNSGYRPALLFVGVIFFFYVVLVGPVNFTWVQRRKQPTLALVTTPILAFLCALLVFAVGYLGKGVVMRYRRIEIVEAPEGSAHGVMVRNTGFFYTRPASATLTLEEGTVGLRYNAEIASGPVIEEGTPLRLEGMRAGLWETAFVREEGVRDLGGGVHFELEGTRIARIRNGSSFALHDAFISDVIGNLYAIGEVAPGATAEIPTTARSYLAAGATLSNSEYDASTQAFLGMLGLDSRGIAPVSSMLGAREIVSYEVPVLYARLDPAASPNISPSFETEYDQRILRIVPSLLPPEAPPAAAPPASPPASPPESQPAPGGSP